MSGDWVDHAACKGENPDTFFPDGKANRRAGEYSVGETKALLICQRCPVRQPCLEWALKAGEQVGVFGGKIASEREAIRSGKPPAVRQPAACGTASGYKQHRRRDEQPCDACKAAYAAAEKARWQQRRARGVAS